MRNLPRSATFALAIAANAAVLASSAPDAAMAASFKTIYAFTIYTGSGAVSPLLLGPNQTFYGMRYGGQGSRLLQYDLRVRERRRDAGDESARQRCRV